MQAADDGDAERLAQFRARAGAEGERQAAEQRGHGGHHDGAEAQQAGLVDGLARRLACLALGFQREVDHHDGVLLHDADQQDDADERDDVELHAEDQQREDRADAGRGQRGENRDRMDVALVEHAEHDVDGDERREDEDRLVGQRAAEGRGGALELGVHAGRHVQVLLRLVDGVDGVAERGAGREVERDGRWPGTVPGGSMRRAAVLAALHAR